MKKRLQGLVAGILVGVLLTGGVVYADQFSKTAELFYNNIKIFIDGAEIVPKDANGNVVAPFIMDGTTYLPVRAVSNAFGKDVEWDGATQSVYIGKKDQTKPDNYLDRVQYNDYKEGNLHSDFAIINGTIIDYNKNVYTNGIALCTYQDHDAIEDDQDEANIAISYPLNSQYESLRGKIVLPKAINITTWDRDKWHDFNTSATDVWFYGDGKLLYKATAVTSSMPFSFDIDTKGVNQLTIKIKTSHRSYGYSFVTLTDLALYK